MEIPTAPPPSTATRSASISQKAVTPSSMEVDDDSSEVDVFERPANSESELETIADEDVHHYLSNSSSSEIEFDLLKATQNRSSRVYKVKSNKNTVSNARQQRKRKSVAKKGKKASSSSNIIEKTHKVASKLTTKTRNLEAPLPKLSNSKCLV